MPATSSDISGTPGTECGTPVIEARGIGVRFSIYGRRQSTKKRVINWLLRPKRSFWALRDVSFSINHGEIFYIIGRNGAGKTTLLKVMAETLFPNAGQLTIWGEVTAFLSMGLGFRMDLSGSDNMEVALQFLGVPGGRIPELRKEIAEFTQLGDFLEMPVKHYSSGMKARLGFAIATSVDPEILLMDEVISAGDEEFRGRCQERLDQMLSKAKAVVICTHNLPNAEAMGTRVMWIEQGEIRAIGDPKEVVNEYRRFIRAVREDPFYDLKAREGRLGEPE